MTVSAAASRNDYVGTGLVDTYSYSFRITSAADLLVTTRDTDGLETTLTYPTDYSVTGVGVFSGGTITLTAGALASGYALTIRDDPTVQQDTDLRNQAGPYQEALEDALDYATRIVKSQQDVLDRALTLSETITGVSAELPAPVAGYALVWNATEDGLQNAIPAGAPTSAFMATVLDDETAADARTTLGVPAAANGSHTGTTATQAVTATTSITVGSGANQRTITGTTETATSSTASRPLVSYENTTSDATSAALLFYKSRGGLATASNDELMSIEAYGRDSNNASRRAARVLVQGGTPGASFVPGAVIIETTNGSGTSQENLRVDATGVVRLAGESAPTGYTSRGDLVLPVTGGVRARNTLKGWINFNASSGTPASIGTWNMSGTITDSGVGDFTVSLSTALASATPIPFGMCQADQSGGFGTGNSVITIDRTAGAVAAGALHIRCVTLAGFSVDPTYVALGIVGP